MRHNVYGPVLEFSIRLGLATVTEATVPEWFRRGVLDHPDHTWWVNGVYPTREDALRRIGSWLPRRLAEDGAEALEAEYRLTGKVSRTDA